MTIKEESHGDYRTLKLEGRLDAISANTLEQALSKVLPVARELELDFRGVEYISSMGLRVILQTYKSAKKYNKKFHITNIPETVREVFKISGFIDVFLRDEKFLLLQTEKAADSATFELTGSFESPKELLEPVQKCLDGHYHPLTITFDCKKLINISQAGCSAVVSLSQKLDKEHIHLILQSVTPEIAELFEVYGHKDFLGSRAF